HHRRHRSKRPLRRFRGSLGANQGVRSLRRTHSRQSSGTDRHKEVPLRGAAVRSAFGGLRIRPSRAREENSLWVERCAKRPKNRPEGATQLSPALQRGVNVKESQTGPPLSEVHLEC